MEKHLMCCLKWISCRSKSRYRRFCPRSQGGRCRCAFLWFRHVLQRKGQRDDAFLLYTVHISLNGVLSVLQQNQRGRIEISNWMKVDEPDVIQRSMQSHDESVMNFPRRSRPMLLVQKVWRFVSMSLSCNTPKTTKKIPLFCAEKGPWSLFFSCWVGSCLKWHFLFSCCSWTPEWVSIVWYISAHWQNKT